MPGGMATWNKILIVLQFWPGDKAHANELAKLIADLQEGHSDKADFMFACRYDTIPDEAAVNHVARKFDTYTHVCRRQASGWPYGCNELWFDAVTYIYEMRSAGKLPAYKGILFIEPDCCPLRVDWIDALSSEWDKLNTNMIGCVCPLPETHINGNCMISGDMAYLGWIRGIAGCPPSGGWDYLLARRFKAKGWSNTPLIVSFYNQPTIAPEKWESFQGISILHGVKDLSAMRLARQKFLGSKP